MKFSEQWLREWVNPPLTAVQLAEQLTMAGLEVGSISPVANEFSKVIIAEVVATEQHPNADRLTLCKVNRGNASETLSIVCGAPNVRRGLKVALAQIGAQLGEKFKIKRSKIRGVESQGMICSSAELGLAEESKGIMELPNDAPVGKDLRDYLALNDRSIHLDLTPNRGDCLGIMGIAREVATLNNLPFKNKNFSENKNSSEGIFPIEINAEEACPRYVGRIIHHINMSAITPIWLRERLRRSGLRSINPVVDVTNYVMLEFGQPVHAFDLNALEQKIQVRFATGNEKLILLNEQEVRLNEDVLVIADDKKPLALAGIMGGKHSGVSSNTHDIFLESAFFAPAIISGKARRYGLSTDASYRFERGVDPTLQVEAIERATKLLLDIAGGEPGAIEDICSQAHLPKAKTIILQKSRVSRILGLPITDDNVKAILHRLHMNVTDEQDNWQVAVPSYRFDLEKDVDLIEEVARVHGYHKIPLNEPVSTLPAKLPSETAIGKAMLRTTLANRGYQETVCYSFVDPKLQHMLDPGHEPLSLINPLASDMAVMRTSLWPGLINVALYNQNRQQARARLFETGQCFIQDKQQHEADSLRQAWMLAGVAIGSAYPEQWGIKVQPVDFYDIKSDIEALLHLTRHAKEFIFKRDEHPTLHPGQSCRIECRSKEAIGWMGMLHPKITQQLDFTGEIFVFELALAKLMQRQLPKFRPLSKFPAIRRDLALLVASNIPAQAIQEVIQKEAGDWLVELILFDCYQGRGIPKGKKSLAFALILQHDKRTLVDDEVNNKISKIVRQLEQQFAAILRDK